MRKAYLGVITLLCMLCLVCTTVFASELYSWSPLFDVVGNYDANYKRSMLLPYAGFSIDFLWIDDDNYRLRPEQDIVSAKFTSDAVLYDRYQDKFITYERKFNVVYSFVTGTVLSDIYGDKIDASCYELESYRWSSTCLAIYRQGGSVYSVCDRVMVSPHTSSLGNSDFLAYDEILKQYQSWQSAEEWLKSEYGDDAYIEYASDDFDIETGLLSGYRCETFDLLEGRLFYPISSFGHGIGFKYDVRYKLAPYVLFTDGVADEDIFQDQKIDLNNSGDYLYLHDDTPQFISDSQTRSSIPTRDGYNFVGWKLTTGPAKDTTTPGGIRPTVEAEQMDDHAPFVVYEAVWAPEGSELSLSRISQSLASVTPSSPKAGDTVTAIFDIIVEGDEGANYTVTSPGTTLVSGSWSGVIGETGEAELSVSKTVTSVQTGQKITNTAYVIPGANTKYIPPHDTHPNFEDKEDEHQPDLGVFSTDPETGYPWHPSDEIVIEIADSGSPKLSIIKTASKTTVAPGDEVTYAIQVSNIGGATAESVKVKDILDSCLIFKSWRINDGVISTQMPSDSVYQLGDIDSGDFATLYITVRVSDGTPNGSIKNTAVASRKP